MLLILVATYGLNAQNVTTQSPQQAGWWTIGINGGLAFQDGDVCTLLEGYGAGLTLAKNIYYQPGAPFSFDLRGRLLYTRTYGLDDFRSYGIDNNTALDGRNNAAIDYTSEGGGPGFVFQNHKSDIGELALEGVLTFNRLKEKTNVILSVFGGIGLDWYKTQVDQASGTGLYTNDYQGIDTTLSRSQIRSTLKNSILDGEYETNADGFKDGGKIDWMPSLGLELGYQLTPRFSMGIGHKVTWARTDILDGQMWDQNNIATGDNDRYHYTNLHLRWIVDPYKTKLRPPYITIDTPNYSPYTSTKDRSIVRAKIKNVNSAVDVEVLVNNIPVNFDYNKGRLYSNVGLQEGSNEVVIKASNAEGTDQESTLIIYKPQSTTTPPTTTTVPSNPATPQARRPEVRFTNPVTNGRRVNDERYEVRATIRNIDSYRDVVFYYNGVEERNFDYNSRTNEFKAPVRLRLGDNSFRIIANNNAGSDRADASVILESVANKPFADIYDPQANPTRTDRENITVRARIQHVEQRKDVVLKINGRKNTNFNFDPYRDEFSTNIRLNEGNNDIRIEACNAAGDVTSDEVRIIYTRPYQAPTVQRPTVRITSASKPIYNPKRPNECRSTITARIENIDNKNNIEFTQNGKRIYSFDFNSRTNIFKSTVDLVRGNNNFVISARNSAGRAQDDTRVQGCAVQDTRQKPDVTITQPNKSYSTSNSKNATIKAKVLHVDSRNDISVLLNGRSTNSFDYNTRTKLLSSSVQLKTGNNEVVIKAVNDVGQDEANVRIKYVGQVIQTVRKPEVTITAPKNNSTTSNVGTTVKASIKNISGKRDISFKQNGKNVSNFSYNPMSKEFEANVQLANGRNTFTIRASNSSGSDEESVRVNFEQTKRPPIVNISKPRNNSTTTKATAAIVATIKNVSKSKDVEFKVNGTRSTKFNFNNTKFTANIKLKPGKNTIIIKGRNNDGQDQKTVNITYNAPVAKPIVKFVNPAKPGTTVSSEKLRLKVTVKRVVAKRDVKIMLNGKKIGLYQFSRKREIALSNLTLKKGKNTIVVEATNEGGKSTASTTINYVPRLVNTGTVKDPANIQKPKITIKQVSVGIQDPFNPGPPSRNITATITNIDNKNQITFIYNGVQKTDFTFNKSTKEFRINVPKTNGTDKFILKARNSAGETVLEQDISS